MGAGGLVSFLFPVLEVVVCVVINMLIEEKQLFLLLLRKIFLYLDFLLGISVFFFVFSHKVLFAVMGQQYTRQLKTENNFKIYIVYFQGA